MINKYIMFLIVMMIIMKIIILIIIINFYCEVKSWNAKS